MPKRYRGMSPRLWEVLQADAPIAYKPGKAAAPAPPRNPGFRRERAGDYGKPRPREPGEVAPKWSGFGRRRGSGSPTGRVEDHRARSTVEPLWGSGPPPSPRSAPSGKARKAIRKEPAE
jgi:hypothetical protein